MAEKRITDLPYMIIYGLLFIGIFSALILSFDDQYTNTNNIGNDLDELYTDTKSGYDTSEKSLQQDTFNTSSFTVVTGSDVDVRGTSQAILSSRNSPSQMKIFMDNVSDQLKLHKYATIFVSSIIIILGITLFLRFLRPGGA